jgi:hypothetical protein
MCYISEKSLSTPLLGSNITQPDHELTELDVKVQALQAEIATLRQTNENNAKSNVLLSPNNYLLEIYPDLKKTFDPENVITFKVPLKDGNVAQFLAPASALLESDVLNRRFNREDMTDTRQKEITLIRPNQTCEEFETADACYQFKAVRYVFGRILGQCPPLKDLKKEEVDPILSEVVELIYGYFPTLSNDYRNYLKEKVFTDFTQCLEYGTSIFEMNDPILLKAWKEQLSKYFKTDKNKQEPIIHYLIEGTNCSGRYCTCPIHLFLL